MDYSAVVSAAYSYTPVLTFHAADKTSDSRLNASANPTALLISFEVPKRLVPKVRSRFCAIAFVYYSMTEFIKEIKYFYVYLVKNGSIPVG